MMAQKQVKSVKGLSLEVDHLKLLVKNLEAKLKELEAKCDKKVTLIQKDRKKLNSFICKECKIKLKDKKELLSHINTTHQKKFKCETCQFESVKLSDIDKHVLETHGPEREYKCNKCESTFISNFRLNKHLKIHKYNIKVKNCHYFNNSKACPYQTYGCKFKHSESRVCRYGVKCNKNLCQFKHTSESSTEVSNRNKTEMNVNGYLSDAEKDYTSSIESVQDNMQNSEEVVYNSTENVNTDEMTSETLPEVSWTVIEKNEYKHGREFFCNQYCSMKYNIHIHDTKNLHKYKGAKINEIEEKFIVENMSFVKIFKCEICDFQSKGFESHEIHYNNIHDDIKFTPGCIFNNCEYESEIPADLVKHYTIKHKKAIEKMKKNKQK